jgi:hypothetical protein
MLPLWWNLRHVAKLPNGVLSSSLVRASRITYLIAVKKVSESLCATANSALHDGSRRRHRTRPSTPLGIDSLGRVQISGYSVFLDQHTDPMTMLPEDLGMIDSPADGVRHGKARSNDRPIQIDIFHLAGRKFAHDESLF